VHAELVQRGLNPVGLVVFVYSLTYEAANQRCAPHRTSSSMSQAPGSQSSTALQWRGKLDSISVQRNALDSLPLYLQGGANETERGKVDVF
jgi:hypothetical protein